MPQTWECQPSSPNSEIHLPHPAHPAVATEHGVVRDAGSDRKAQAPPASVDPDAGGGAQPDASRGVKTGTPAVPGADTTLPDAPQDVIPVDRERSLRLQATSLEHCLTHKPKNPFCDVCTMTRSKTNIS